MEPQEEQQQQQLEEPIAFQDPVAAPTVSWIIPIIPPLEKLASEHQTFILAVIGFFHYLFLGALTSLILTASPENNNSNSNNNNDDQQQEQQLYTFKVAMSSTAAVFTPALAKILASFTVDEMRATGTSERILPAISQIMSFICFLALAPNLILSSLWVDSPSRMYTLVGIVIACSSFSTATIDAALMTRLGEKKGNSFFSALRVGSCCLGNLLFHIVIGVFRNNSNSNNYHHESESASSEEKEADAILWFLAILSLINSLIVPYYSTKTFRGWRSSERAKLFQQQQQQQNQNEISVGVNFQSLSQCVFSRREFFEQIIIASGIQFILGIFRGGIFGFDSSKNFDGDKNLKGIISTQTSCLIILLLVIGMTVFLKFRNFPLINSNNNNNNNNGRSSIASSIIASFFGISICLVFWTTIVMLVGGLSTMMFSSSSSESETSSYAIKQQEDATKENFESVSFSRSISSSGSISNDNHFGAERFSFVKQQQQQDELESSSSSSQQQQQFSFLETAFSIISRRVISSTVTLSQFVTFQIISDSLVVAMSSQKNHHHHHHHHNNNDEIKHNNMPKFSLIAIPYTISCVMIEISENSGIAFWHLLLNSIEKEKSLLQQQNSLTASEEEEEDLLMWNTFGRKKKINVTVSISVASSKEEEEEEKGNIENDQTTPNNNNNNENENIPQSETSSFLPKVLQRRLSLVFLPENEDLFFSIAVAVLLLFSSFWLLVLRITLWRK